MKLLAFLLALLAPTPALSDIPESIANANGVVTVHQRDFLVGDLHDFPMGLVTHRRFMVRSSIWLRVFLDNDPILFDHDFELLRTGIPAEDLLAQITDLNPTHCCVYTPVDTPSWQVEGFETYFNGFGRVIFLPTNSSLPHGIKCSLRHDDRQQLSYCRISVAYPHDSHILLTGGIFFAGTIADYGPRMADVVARMTQIITCIDITDQTGPARPATLSEISERHPNLDGCEIDQIS